jgi:hypothetical protein
MDHAESAVQALALGRLVDCMPGLLPELAVVMAYAAAVCLEEEGHSSGVWFGLAEDGEVGRRFTLSWPPATEPALRSWADPEEATEVGACAVAALLVDAIAGLHVLERSRRGTGFDYWLGQSGHSGLLFQDKTRLEVSGIRHAQDEAEMKARERLKVRQVARGEPPALQALPRIVVIVDFGVPRSRLRRK